MGPTPKVRQVRQDRPKPASRRDVRRGAHAQSSTSTAGSAKTCEPPGRQAWGPRPKFDKYGRIGQNLRAAGTSGVGPTPESWQSWQDRPKPASRRDVRRGAHAQSSTSTAGSAKTCEPPGRQAWGPRLKVGKVGRIGQNLRAAGTSGVGPTPESWQSWQDRPKPASRRDVRRGAHAQSSTSTAGSAKTCEPPGRQAWGPRPKFDKYGRIGQNLRAAGTSGVGPTPESWQSWQDRPKPASRRDVRRGAHAQSSTSTAGSAKTCEPPGRQAWGPRPKFDKYGRIGQNLRAAGTSGVGPTPESWQSWQDRPKPASRRDVRRGAHA